MMELIRNAWLLGWPDYTGNGKFVALLLVVLVLYWLVRKELKEKYNTLAIYTTVMTVCCICPLTAGVLMMYQTRFYDYQWIWNLVPVTIVIALAGALLWTEFLQRNAGQKGQKWKIVMVTAAMLGIVYISGSMGNTVWQADEEAAKRQETSKVLEILAEEEQATEIMLWAPQGIMEYARALNGTIQLPYGRNMWDISLNAYTYDVYGAREKTLYAWMCNAEDTGEGEVGTETEETVTGVDCMAIAAELGVTHILLPANLLPEVLEELEVHLDMQAETVEGYYLFRF